MIGCPLLAEGSVPRRLVHYVHGGREAWEGQTDAVRAWLLPILAGSSQPRVRHAAQQQTDTIRIQARESIVSPHPPLRAAGYPATNQIETRWSGARRRSGWPWS